MTASRLFLVAVLAVLPVLTGCGDLPSPFASSSPDTTTADTILTADTVSADTMFADTTTADSAVLDRLAPGTTATTTSPAAAPDAESQDAATTTSADASADDSSAKPDSVNQPPLAEAESDSTVASDDETTLENVRSYGFRFVMALLVFLLTFFAIKGAVFVLETLAERSAERRLLYKRIIPIARIILWALALVIVLRGIFSVDARSLLAAATAIGVAVGFAAQDILKNIFGGLVIIFDQPFQAGDKISVGGTYGEVLSIGLRSTRIVTPDDNLVSVPNAQVVDGQVSNANAGALDCQVVTDLYLPGWADEQRAKQIAYQAAASSAYTYLEKPIAVIVKDEYDDGHMLHLKVKAYVLDARFEFLLASDVTERARRVFREEGLLMPATRAYVDLPASK